MLEGRLDHGPVLVQPQHSWPLLPPDERGLREPPARVQGVRTVAPALDPTLSASLASSIATAAFTATAVAPTGTTVARCAIAARSDRLSERRCMGAPC